MIGAGTNSSMNNVNGNIGGIPILSKNPVSCFANSCHMGYSFGYIVEQGVAL
jgi:hypothetical protein